MSNGLLNTAFSIPVTEDDNDNLKLTSVLRSELKPGVDFSFFIEEAIRSNDRYYCIMGRQQNPVELVEAEISDLRNSIQRLWHFDSTKRVIDRTQLNLTSEHYKRSGELLAQGLALVFIEKRLNIPRQRFFFYEGTKARPDFIGRVKRYHKRALLLEGRRFAIEARLRNSKPNIYGDDRAKILDKKKGMTKTAAGLASAIGVYLFYGDGYFSRKKRPHTRLHICDPQWGGGEYEESDLALTTIHHYLRATSRVGLWDHRDHLISAAKAPSLQKVANSISMPQKIMRGEIETFNGHKYRGRWFHGLIEDRFKKPETLQERNAIKSTIRQRIENEDYGYRTFYGIRESVLSMIENCSWQEIFNFMDDSTSEERTFISSDGFVRHLAPIDPYSKESLDLRKSLGL